MSLYETAQVALIALWVLWAWPFFAYKARTPKRPAEVTDKTSRWGIGLQMVGYFLVWQRVRSPGARAWPWLALGLLLAVPAVILSWTAIRSLGKQLRVQAGLYSDHELIRRGPYRIVRHPIYLGMLLMFLATMAIMTLWQLMLPALVLFLAGTEIRVRLEDRLLRSRFGAEFEAYRDAVPAYLPGLR